MGNFPDGGNTVHKWDESNWHIFIPNELNGISFLPKHFAIHHCNVGKLSHSYSSLQRDISPSSNKTTVSLHGIYWSLRWVDNATIIREFATSYRPVGDERGRCWRWQSSIFSYALCGASVSTATAISLDRLLALLLGLRYRQLVTVTRVRSVVACIWFLAASCGLVRLWNYHAPLKIAVFFGGLLSIISVSSHMKIWCRLHHQRFQVRDRLYHRKVNEVAQYKKTVSSIAWVQLVLLACYVPFLSVSMLISVGFRGKMIYIAWLSTATLVYLNSTLNPIVYFWKMTEVRRRVKETIQQCLCL